ncbi:tRNA uridine-5-carboxymethylaminomethyl(34) synthesis GTPase MnmE [Palleronia caenipelagi]|uniref:tRNA modification GTPase MnmE n=1 Tax=Palleronia caenipelagi TaxID=2489174 RepID=A0A547Q8V2_9RHOB|nr:tRNA uridine-5-carboxymethylaminomethyl(34) synthesis GTPase MnmE [Palleronia caenipelagi]TRD22784.1 tRNA uridine-5-carboxymethylaminomethyl(34) synthesis GTPase MnmE [Palleronia caenipelagi]
MDTIYALATAPGKAGVAVIRLTGPRSFDVAGAMCGSLPMARQAALRKIRSKDGDLLDTALVLVFEKGASFTGEDVVEFQVHGSQAVIQAILRELAQDLRLADPGEFTRRALENGCLDLVQVEALADLIDAETEFQRQQAQEVLSGALSKRVDGWRRALVDAAALLEATIDFADEDVPMDVVPDVERLLGAVVADLKTELRGSDAAERIRDGFEVAIMGPPNAGKSTLLNAIARRNVALTSDIAGTTRDVIELRVDLNGLPVTFLDTAGLRETSDPLEAAGIDLAVARAERANLRIWLSTGSDDLVPEVDRVIVAKDDNGQQGGVSGATGAGVTSLLDWIADTLLERVPQQHLLIRDRHVAAMEGALNGLLESLEMIRREEVPELIALEIRQASQALSEIVGDVDVEDLLDSIFSRFCIGK